MKKKLIILSVTSSTYYDTLPLLQEYFLPEQLVSVALIDDRNDDPRQWLYVAGADDEIWQSDRQPVSLPSLSVRKLTDGLQQLIGSLEAKGAEIVLLLGCGRLKTLVSDQAVLFDPDRIVPPLAEAIINDQRAGIIISSEAGLKYQHYKWRNLGKTPYFSVVNLNSDNNDALTEAALRLQEQGAEVIVLDCNGSHLYHLDLLQKLLRIPVLLPMEMMVKLAAELLV